MTGIELFIYDVLKKAAGSAVGGGILEGIKSIFPKKNLEKLQTLANEKKEKEFKEILEMILEANSDIKENILKLQKGETITTNNQIHNGNGDNIGRDQIINKK